MTINQPQDEPDQLADYYIPSITAALDILKHQECPPELFSPDFVPLLITIMHDALEALEHHAHPDEFNLIAEEPRERPCPYEMMLGQLAARFVYAYQNKTHK